MGLIASEQSGDASISILFENVKLPACSDNEHERHTVSLNPY